MIVAPMQPRAWPRRRWWLTVLVVFAGQLGLIFWLSDRAPIRERPAASSPRLRLAGPGVAEFLALYDPTLFALPHRQGFAGQGWMTIPQPPTNTFFWSEQPHWLALGLSALGTTFNQFVATNQFNPVQVWTPPELALALPELATQATVPASSALRITGSLALRELLTPIALRSWPHPDLLTNSVVQMVVDSEGRPMSLTLLSSSGSSQADQRALELARAARFNPIPDQGKSGGLAPELAWGTLIFEWVTVPMPPTNASPPAAASP